MQALRTFRMVTSDDLSLSLFGRWHEALVSVAERGPAGDYLLPAYGFRFNLRKTELAVPDCDLSWGVASKECTVQINPAGSAGDANVLSSIGEDRRDARRYAVLRQGRLQRNRQTAGQISGGEFRHAFQKLPVSASGSFGAKSREWYLVCDLGDDVQATVRQTADFVQRCDQVRVRQGARGPE